MLVCDVLCYRVVTAFISRTTWVSGDTRKVNHSGF